MSEENEVSKVDQALANLIDKAVDSAEKAAEFSADQLPQVIEQMLTFHMAEAFITLAACAAYLFWFVHTVVSSWRKARAGDEDTFLFEHAGLRREVEPTMAGIAMFMIGGATSVGCVIGVFSTASTALQIWLAPKLYILEYGASLVK